MEAGGVERLGLTARELALACASHEGSDDHVRVAQSILAKAGLDESYLQCGAHLPGDAKTYRRMIKNEEKATPIRNNCSGKHSTMLAYAKMRGLPLNHYLDFGHPVQQEILASFAEMSLFPANRVELGIDGCSAPNFAIPLYNAALAFARLADPRGLPESRAKACKAITSAMTSHPEMISGPGEFDCRLMQIGAGRIICKRGAEGYQAIGLLPGAIHPDSPGIGISLKIMDGDLGQRRPDLTAYTRVRPAVTLEILEQLGALHEARLQQLSEFGPVKPVTNHQGLVVGESRTTLSLSF